MTKATGQRSRDQLAEPLTGGRPVGTSNRSHGPCFRVVGTGVHTIRFVWRDADWEQIDARMRRIGVRIRPTTWQARDRAGIASFECWKTKRGDRLFVVQARLGSLLSGSPEDGSLRPAQDIPLGEVAARRITARNGISLPPARAAVHRVDLAGDVRFARPEAGLAFLNVLQHLVLPPLAKQPRSAPASSRVESVSWFHGKRMVFRAYDKDEQQKARGHHVQPGERIRLERQYTARKQQQRSPADLGACDVGALFSHYVARWAQPGLLAGPTDVHCERLLASDRGDLVKERLLGAIVLFRTLGDAAWTNPRTAARRRRELADIGIGCPELDAERELDFGCVLAALVEAWT